METAKARTLEELGAVARTVAGSCEKKESACVIGLTGELGAGKTAFVKELAKDLGVAHEITSPTFVIMKSYPITKHPFLKTLTHIDAYRIESDDEMRVLGFDAILGDKDRLVCIEWPEKIQNILPEDILPVTLNITDGETRTITYGP
jgi:tRNA threonylcarbamoyladenosine biosynthesis protein TsaE